MLNKNILALVLITALLIAANASAGFITTQNPEWGSTEGYFGIRVTPNPATGEPIGVLTKYNANGTVDQSWSSASYDAQIVNTINAQLPALSAKLDNALNILHNGLGGTSAMDKAVDNVIKSIGSFQFGLNVTLTEGVVSATLGLNQFVLGNGGHPNDYFSATNNAYLYNYAVNAVLGGSSTLYEVSQNVPADLIASLFALAGDYGFDSSDPYSNTTGYDTGHGVIDSVLYDGNGSLDVLVTLTVEDLEKFAELAHRWFDGGFSVGYSYEYYVGTGEAAAAPEPATMLMFGLGIAGIAVARRIRRK